MKRFIASAALLMCTMLMTGSFAQVVAQDPPDGLIVDLACVPDCPDAPFVGSWQYTDVIVCSGCVVRVKWISRKACGNFDIYIEEATSIDPNNPACMACYPNSLQALIEDVTQQLLRSNPMNYPPRVRGECYTNWRAVKGPCWMRHFPDFSSNNESRVQSRTQACVGHETFCSTNYQVCVDESDKRTVVRLAGIPSSTYPGIHPGVVCTGMTLSASLSGKSYDCENVCNGTSR